ncbi:DUF4293 domain-containing protein [Xanthomarina sp. GH4-25]|uniref:DUF4293 domain-containing protein n=1 Tax=Xanthomarina sp. GH4-25 TaxID=3349335 RepID=UPI000D67A0A7|nr:DUF4293 domain-containing protein [Flavobacteriaceae bacterium LYZ1037]
MLQRIQTIYLLIAAGVSGGFIFVFELWTSPENVKVYADDVNYIFAIFLVSAFFSILAISRFKHRKSQFMLGRLNILLNFFLLGLFVYQSLNLSGETVVSEKGIGIFLPIISIVFLALANKAIKKDEDLVKSVDRLR